MALDSQAVEVNSWQKILIIQPRISTNEDE